MRRPARPPGETTRQHGGINAHKHVAIMNRHPDDPLIAEQFRLLAQRADQFSSTYFWKLCAIAGSSAAAAGVTDEISRHSLRAWLQALTQEAASPAAFLTELVIVGCRRMGLRYSADLCSAMGIALLDALQEVIGEGFTGRARDAWSRAFALAADEIDEFA